MTYIPTKTTYLEMRSQPARACPVTPVGVEISRVERPSVEYYRHLYNSVGRDYRWVDRNLLADEALRQIVQHDRVEIYILHLDRETAGFAELDRRSPNEVELAYFGLFPAFLGRGLGKYFLSWLVDQAWKYEPRRFWVHTCDLDHPAALPNYLKVGFTIYGEKLIDQVIVD